MNLNFDYVKSLDPKAFENIKKSASGLTPKIKDTKLSKECLENIKKYVDAGKLSESLKAKFVNYKR